MIPHIFGSRVYALHPNECSDHQRMTEVQLTGVSFSGNFLPSCQLTYTVGLAAPSCVVAPAHHEPCIITVFMLLFLCPRQRQRDRRGFVDPKYKSMHFESGKEDRCNTLCSPCMHRWRLFTGISVGGNDARIGSSTTTRYSSTQTTDTCADQVRRITRTGQVYAPMCPLRSKWPENCSTKLFRIMKV